MKILVVKVSALGDVVHALPVLSWIKSAEPSARIDWLVEDSFAPLLEGHSDILNVVRIGTKKWRRSGWLASAKGALSVISRLRDERYDVVLDLQGNCKSGFFALTTGAPRRFGFDRDSVREWPNLLSTNYKVALTESEYHVSDRSLAIARAAFPSGSEIRSAGPLPVPQDIKEAVRSKMADHGLLGSRLVILHYGTTWKTKLWSLDSWKELARRLRCFDGMRTVLTWGNDEERSASELISKASGGGIVLWPRGTLPELVALLEAADLVVGCDTGPVHIAAAVGTPTVSLYRVTDSRRNGPRGEDHILLQSSLDCSPCLRKVCERDSECAKDIGVDAVIKAIEGISAKFVRS